MGMVRQVLAGEVVTDSLVEESTLGIGVQEQLVAVRRKLEVEIALPRAKGDLKMVSQRVVESGGQKSGFQHHAHFEPSRRDYRRDLA
jgi:hypothetical protein